MKCFSFLCSAESEDFMCLNLGCPRNNIGYKIPGQKCLAAYVGETRENMQKGLKSHLSKINYKLKYIREGSALWKHLDNTHIGLKDGEAFNDYFEVLY